MSHQISSPSALSPEMKRFWRKITREFALSPEHQRILEMTCRAYDRADSARRRIKRDGLIVKGQRHVLLSTEAKATELFYRGIRDLGLPKEVISDARSK